ncbi:hypothetical protein AYO20_05637 [Fonsecaea nubica]|uniref:Uncharacterized protein n=1 Tax=Fonsecaea nubica TaxID=856822 RepID=A0A178CZ45_9EURO|nr:hypothetical protein AYO20_05637 [Fonsecaea nubica]OAL35160.1 hypothetical protein AYO20_05637 [Fonsecaea nubica]
MRAQAEENAWANADVSYPSAVWGENVAASQVFILPTFASGEGTRQLLSITKQGINDLSVQTCELAHEARTADHEQFAIKCAVVDEHRRQQRAQGSESQTSDVKVLSAKISALRIIKDFEFYAVLVQQAHGVAEHLVGKFEQLQKVAQTVLTEQEEKGTNLAKTPEAVKKLTISMKCVDSIWADIIASWKKLKRLDSGIQKGKTTLPPLRDNLKLIGINITGAEESDNPALEGKDQDISATDSEAKFVHKATLEESPMEEKGDATEPSSSNANSLFDTDAMGALIEKFVEKCMIRDARHYASEDGNDANLNAPALKDSDSDKTNPSSELVNTKGTQGEVENTTVADAGANGEEIAVSSEGDEEDDSDELDIICSEPSSPAKPALAER